MIILLKGREDLARPAPGRFRKEFAGRMTTCAGGD
jgi:hypothetical protein